MEKLLLALAQVTSYEYHIENFKGFLQLAAAVILLRHL
jgi:hypothetical protein